MKIKVIVSLTVLAACIAAVLPAAAAQDTAAVPQSDPDAPVAFVQEPEYEFKPVFDGNEVLHDFVIENTGGAALLIQKVTSSCGCTTADYTKEIPPGGQGKISIKANTGGYAGSKFSKNITVYTNDPKQPRLMLLISGQVNRFVTIEPENVNLKGIAGQKIQTSVNIVPDTHYPFNILESLADKGKNIRFALEKKADGYVLTVENLLETAGRYFDKITLKTDNPAMPRIAVNVYGNILSEK